MTGTTERAYVALGANIGQPLLQVEAGFAALAALPGTCLVRRSSLYRSAPVGYADQPDFINAVAAIDTVLSPRALLEALLEVERVHGRVRGLPNGPRTLDLDIVLYGRQRIEEPGLTVPHARMLERAFVMRPLAEIAPETQVPGAGCVRDIADRLDAAGLQRVAA
jgi:2-amino-4-hydroxy-6-hydroxymethyldihydropteridine diphosphokinase